MCGICGIINFDQRPVDPYLLKRMTDLLAHRGPDDKGAVLLFDLPRNKCQPIEFKEIDELRTRSQTGTVYNVGLGHRRLSIIDLSEAGHQPMCNENRTVWITYNGEIYNYRELTSHLTARGHKFRSNTDTEAIIHLYEEYGERCVDRLRGMFAFAIWDHNKRLLLLARDRVGKKPLFYHIDQGKFIFSSSVKSILINPGMHKDINFETMHHFLTYGYTPTNETIYKGIEKLPPAHVLLCKDGKFEKIKYWELADSYMPQRPSCYKIENYAKRVLELLEECVKLRLISDVPLGALLSGGIDSSAIVAMMSKLMSEPVKTFSIGFDDKSFNELVYARRVAECFKTEHHEFVVTPKAIEILPELIWHCDEPFADSSILPVYYLSKMIRQYVRVVLGGDGGDESFAGYETYIAQKLARWYQPVSPIMGNRFIMRILNAYPESTKRIDILRRWKRFMEKANLSIGKREWRWIFSNQIKERIYSNDLKAQIEDIDSLAIREDKFFKIKNADVTTRLLYLDISIYLPEDLLVKADRASMANSLEIRSPFLDHNLMEYAASIPSNMKFRGFALKYVLKRALEDRLPKAIINRNKQGFGIPLGSWFRGELKDMAYNVLLDEKAINRGYFKKDEIQNLLDEHCNRKYDHGYKIWCLLNLELWHKTFMDKNDLSKVSLEV